MMLAKKKCEEMEEFDRAKAKNVIREKCKRKALVIVLEECDQKKHLKAVCDLFEIANLEDSKLVLIAIGNSADFVLQNHLTVAQEMAYGSYSAEDLEKIVREKLTDSLCSALFDAKALTLWARKASEVVGDLRNATGCLESAIDVAELAYLSTDQTGDGKITFKLMRDAVEGWGSSKDTLNCIAGLTPQARVLLIGMARESEKNSSDEFGLSDIRKIYCHLFQQERPESGVLRSLIGQLLDTPFLSSHGSNAHVNLSASASNINLYSLANGSTGGSSGERYCIKLDKVIVEKAIAADETLSRFVQ
jgi:Cdc6-like AAA superfamily ATPase